MSFQDQFDKSTESSNFVENQTDGYNFAQCSVHLKRFLYLCEKRENVGRNMIAFVDERSDFCFPIARGMLPC